MFCFSMKASLWTIGASSALGSRGAGKWFIFCNHRLSECALCEAPLWAFGAAWECGGVGGIFLCWWGGVGELG